MSLWALFVTHSPVILMLLLAAPSLSDARPVDASPVQRPSLTPCTEVGMSPCLCDGRFGLQGTSEGSQEGCPERYIGYKYPGHPRDGNLTVYPYVSHFTNDNVNISPPVM
jgi:hypothetical protein